jgi:chemotaxis protein CheC
MEILTSDQLDALHELFNVGVGQAAGMLNQMLGMTVKLRVPVVHLLQANQVLSVLNEFGVDPVAAVKLPFRGEFDGFAVLIFPPADAAQIANNLMGQDSESTDMDALRVGTINEVGNVVLNAVLGTISNQLEMCLRYSIPTYREITVGELFQLDLEETSQSTLIVARVNFLLLELEVEGNIVVYLHVGGMEPLVNMLDKLVAPTDG